MSYNSVETYSQTNEYLSKLFFNQRIKVRLFQNAQLALYDITACLLQFLSHRPNIGVAKNGSSLIESLNPVWQRSSVSMQVKQDSQHWAEYIESLNPDTNFVIWASENEISGEIIVDEVLADEIHQKLSKKKIFSIQVCHRFELSKEMSPYSIIILRPNIFQNEKSLVLITDKMKAPTLIGSFQEVAFSEDETLKLKTIFFVNQSNLQEIKEAEKKVTHFSQVYFHQFVDLTPRLADRIVFCFKDFNAHAIKTDLSLTDQQAFTFSQFPFWYLDLFKNWWKEAASESLLRGLLVVSVDALRREPLLVSMIMQSEQKIRQLSQWSINS